MGLCSASIEVIFGHSSQLARLEMARVSFP